ncbi:related to dihydrodipicolinate synthetase [Moesziomyces antarcticus]|nr:related to dihydrodipicolinate synthetase [Moesziomyces antarcticus]
MVALEVVSSVEALPETKTLKRGIYVPVLTFFTGEHGAVLDLEAFEKHIAYVATSGVAGIVALGSTGEAVSLTDDEKVTLVRSTRKAMNACGCSDMPLIAGAGGHSVVTARASLAAMASAGASHALVLPSSYYPNQLGAPAALDFYTAIADSSPIPILIYSYPGVCSGINLSSDVTRKLSHHPRIRGVKHTDHDIGKMARNCALPAAAGDGVHFFVLGGASDYLIGALAVGAHGTITGMGNIAPRAVVQLQRLFDQGRHPEATELQHIVSLAEWELGKGGVPMHKALVDSFHGYGGLPRAPLQPSPKETVQQAVTAFHRLMQVEQELAKST